MRQSQLFTKVEKSGPKDEVSASAQLLARAGFVRKMSAGVYAYLPLGWRVIQKISDIIREEMNAVGGQELFMPALVEKKYLDITQRSDVPIGFEVRGTDEKETSFVLGWTHEEILTAIASKFVHSYKDLPFAAYQIQTKFRNEPRAQGGLLRTREFLMKDLYSFHASEDDFRAFYERATQAYAAIFKRVGLAAILTVAPGGDFTVAHTHEFQVVSDVGEDTIVVCSSCGYAENTEVSGLTAGKKCPACGGAVEEKRSIEVGNIFPLGTKYSEPFGLSFADEDGAKHPVVMGSYGIGIGRVMATVAEVHHDDRGIVWPDSIAPFNAHLIQLPGGNGEAAYRDLQKAGITVLYDDRDASAGEKFAEADLIGIPYRLVVSEKTGTKIEVKGRSESGTQLMEIKEFIGVFSKIN